MKKYSALIIDDEPDIRQLIALTLSRMDMECYQAANVSEALSLLSERPYHFCVTDMKLPDGNGLEIIQLCHARYSDMPVAMITAYGSMDMAVEALKAGAFDVVAKPLDITRLRELVAAALQLTRVPVHLESLPSSDALLGRSTAMMALKEKIQKVARTQAPVFIHGESGTGKELVARLIHHQSSRADSPFIPVNCGAIPKDLMESEFFGHKRGAFTGASADKDGFFKAAEGGTLFLDEVAELPIEMQAKLLRVIQEKATRAVGSEHEIPIDVRILSASHKDLAQLVEQERFRQDLFFRLDVIQIAVPRLSERQEDIPTLVGHFIRKYSSEWGMPEASIDQKAMTALIQYHYPGNVRELENILQRAVTMAEGDEISQADLNLPDQVTTTPSTLLMPAIDPAAAIETSNLEAYLENIERNAITQALEATRWNKTAAAEKLGISFRALRYRCKKLDID
ncbi:MULTISPECIES: sigma-54 dependent transcriptional regulator [unclassified Oceanobacter]|jgi:two-component system response regulator PilR (NtrC family)|uniref:sigma-54-dependent transcriptional regulator n=1 Tax=unclassified Oceanobacter TaxID=2620260 RepID=UPI0026E482D7|nr:MULTISPECIES: sigma-54 dependent transcriptional regulator [unclassified Oceanobacter]MDO6681262.1 sigma-54 dependent transcriptional regulator [Oceanobacter sp. 5_MG-2023]MDP2505219.1 sigma-54 dependent transcriptional regulator [Oceanobacter sp. 3_MG-2023]MDP2549204.1 sigma-54 dependent transcriptional regulator [Oceanobacter sp. 4_MG-2023]MDP2608007.1 sigma-54 dependent transcriptional regulator [Oceanobacter sp. 1_MG-2023]MDP2611331.1 sigma-54 dependent transcriptional regulator [Oceano